MRSRVRQLGKARNFVTSFALERVQSRAQAGGQRSIVVAGARRSGHHAVLMWLANSLEARQAEWNRLGTAQCFVSKSRRTIHVNTWRIQRGESESWRTFQLRHILRSSDHLIVNYEDVDPFHLDRHMWFPSRPDLKVVVRRSTLNLLASRLKKVEIAPSSAIFRIDETFLDKLSSYWREMPDWLLVDFDSWLRNENGYRESIAARAGFMSGVDPDLSGHGGGSSFAGLAGLPSVLELTNRFTQVEWPVHVVKLLLEDKYSFLLTRHERDFLRSRGG